MIARRFCLPGPSFPLLVVALIVSACYTVPETGRKSFNVMSQAQEAQLGLATFNQMKQEMKVSTDPAAKAMVERVGRRIAAVAPLPDAQWEFVVFDSPEANAFCLPGGKVGVYTGLLPVTEDDDGLAVVIGHEVAHAVARHGGERMTHATGLNIVGQVLGAATAESEWQQAAVTAYGLGTQLGVALPHSRAQESEADHLGLIYMARAGYPPEAAIAFWERFAAYNRQHGDSTAWFLRTHPLDETRIRQLEKWLPEARQQMRPAAK